MNGYGYFIAMEKGFPVNGGNKLGIAFYCFRVAQEREASMIAQYAWFLEVGASIIGVVGFATHAQGQGTFTMKDVLRAWEARQNRAHSARFHLVEKKFIAKGSKGTPMGPMKSNISGPIPEEDISYEVAQIVTFDGPKIRYSREGQEVSMFTGKLIELSDVMAFDGEKVKEYWKKGALGHPAGNIAPGTPMTPSLISLQPLFLFYRATYPDIRLPFKVSDLQKTDETAVIDGRKCVALRLYARPPARGEETYWVDTERDYLLRRHDSSLNGKVNLQLDINYIADDRHGWVPSAWRFVYYLSGGGFGESGDTRVEKYEINGNIDPGEFDLTFPPGTVLNEYKDDGNVVRYIKKDRGENRLITEADRGKSYQDVLNEDSNRIGVWKITVGIFAAALIASLVILWRRKYSRLRKSNV